MAVIKAKSSVRPRAVFIICAIANVAAEMGIEVLITSVDDSKHMQGSFHYAGAAVDVRSRSYVAGGSTMPMPALMKKEFLARVLSRLGGAYQGFLESAGASNEHFHFEHDPR